MECGPRNEMGEDWNSDEEDWASYVKNNNFLFFLPNFFFKMLHTILIPCNE